MVCSPEVPMRSKLIKVIFKLFFDNSTQAGFVWEEGISLEKLSPPVLTSGCICAVLSWFMIDVGGPAYDVLYTPLAGWSWGI